MKLETQPANLVSTVRRNCPLCAGSRCDSVLSVNELPINIGRLWPDEPSAKAAPRGDVVLAFCRTCGFVFNAAYDSRRLSYEPGYEYSLHHSPSHREFLESTADRLVAKYELYDKDIVEVGCGSGFFLQLLSQRGANRGWGFDPAVGTSRSIDCGAGRVTLTPDYYDASQREIPCDMLVCRSMFELVEQPHEFLRAMRSMLDGRPLARFYLDIPSAAYVFRKQALWNFFYEQCNYFVEETLCRAFRDAGFDVLASGECLGEGYYLYIEAAPAGRSPTQSACGKLQTPSSDLLAMAERLESERVAWRRRFSRWREQKKRVVAWGSGGRAINFLNMVEGASLVRHVIDINPARHGGFISGSGQQVVAPDELPALSPDIVIVTNSLYGEEIRRHVAELNVTCEFAEI